MTDPLVPADCNLQDFPFMPVDVRRLLASETWVLGRPDERAAAMALWLESWHQVPAASLPNNDRMLGHLAQTANWKRVREQSLRGWLLCTDGRLYHPVVAEKALEAWIEKLLSGYAGATGNAKRWNVDIDTQAIKGRLVLAVDMLNSLAPASKTLKKKAVVQILRPSPPESPPDTDSDRPPTSEIHRPPIAIDRDIDIDRDRDLLNTTPPDGGESPTGREPTIDLLGHKLNGHAPKTVPDCPHLEILALWAEVMPDLPQHDPEMWPDSTRADHLRARWRATSALKGWASKDEGLRYFRKLFTWCRGSSFLMGKANTRDRRPFEFELAWLVNATNWTKVHEGKFHG